MKRKIWLSVCAAIVAALCAFGIVACGEHKHNYAKEVTAPTCTEQGFTTYTCDCGESYVGDYQTELGHQYSEWNISETHHWRDTLCGCEIPTEYMDHTDNGNGICSICDAPLNPTEGILYDVSADGTCAEVIAYTGTANIIKIADAYEGLPVKNIYDNAFKNASITSIIIPDSVMSIGDDAFFNCSSLTSVMIGNSVTSIGSSAFSNCSSLTSVVIPDGVMSIGDDAFFNCSKLTSITIPDSVTSIGKSAFSGCYSLTEITLPFVGATKDGTKNKLFGYLFGASSYSYNAYYVPTSLKKVTITSALSIGDYAFYQCSNLTHITIPDSVTSISDRAFSYCSSLTSIMIPDSVMNVGWAAFDNCYSLTSVMIGDSVTSIGGFAFSGCSRLTSITIPDSVTSIGDDAFYNCSRLTSITISSSVKSIGASAFKNCSNLQYNVKDNLKYLGNENNDYFALITVGNKNFSSYKIDKNTKVVANAAFYGCNNLTHITIPDSVTSISDSAFHECNNLTHITIPDSVTSIESFAFSNCSSLTRVEIPNSVTSIDNSAFSDCSSLTRITIPDSVMSIGNFAFSGCSRLTSITIPDSVTSIGYDAFSGCSSLQYNVNNNLKYLGNTNNPYLYLADTTTMEITTATIENGCIIIGSSAFSSCRSLTNVVIPDSVKIIGEGAFEYCYNLTSVVFKNPNGWWYASSYSATNGENISSSSLSNVSTAAQYLWLTYNDCYWKRT